jgi:hypothetical protein
MVGQMTEPYLILHKVRGEPAFDIAEKTEIDGEEAWIVSTSGHRAYPIDYWPLNKIEVLHNGVNTYIDEIGEYENWEGLPDHYYVLRRPSRDLDRQTTTASALLRSIGLGPKPIPRRKI